jgi:hypothetical protein
MDTLFDDTLLAPAAESTPEAATAYEELACCNVCGEGDWEEDNKIIFCDSCDLAVHQVCYGAGARVIPEGDAPWFCDMCKFSKRAGGSSRRVEQECILCPEKGGAMKRTTDGRWAHITCALWVPNAQFLDAEGRDVIHPFAIHEDRLKLVCTICDKRMGACIQCKAPRCLTAFHATCARKLGWHMVEKEKNDWVLLEALCDKHRPKDVTQRKKRRRRESKW